MRNAIFTLFIIAASSFSVTHAEDACLAQLNDHMNIIAESEVYIKNLSPHSKEITSYEIIEFQKVVTARYISLKKLLKSYEENENCLPKVMPRAVAIYDFSTFGKSVFTNPELRRVVKGFKRYPNFKLTDFIASYEQYTNNEFIEKTQLEIMVAGNPLPRSITISTSEIDYDPNLYAFSDTAMKGTTAVVAGVARVWGFISDQLKWREGHIGNNPDIKAMVESTLRPLDLMYEKRSFVLSNYTIPGHWGHVAIWLGTKEELIALNIWDQEYFRPFRHYVEEGKSIIEVRKSGINFQSLDTFLNIDEFAITRFNNLQSKTSKIYEDIFSQVDKKYDFKFDVRSADKITCTELISFSYGDIKWPETKTLFQLNLRPDDVAIMTLDSSSNEEFVLYLKGNKKLQPVSFLGFEDWKKIFKLKKNK
jgi:hypothetical protein